MTQTSNSIEALTPTINGEAYNEGSQLDIYEPATGEIIGQMPDVGPEGVDVAVAAAKSAHREWSNTTPKDRANALLALADALEDNAQIFGELEARDVGKPLNDAVAEMGSAADKYRFFAGATRALTTAAAGEYKPGITSMVRSESLGVVAALTPWNYPMGLTSWKIAPALAAGNTVVLKPPTEASMTSMLLADMAKEILPPGVLNVITGRGSGTGSALAGHQDVSMVSLTGGTNTGKIIMRQAAETMKKVHLELGGKAPVLVFEDADLEKFTATMAGAMFRNSGQDCTAATRVYVAESMLSEVLDRLESLANGVRFGNGFLDPSVQMGPVSSFHHRDNVAGFVERAKSTGHIKVVAGGYIPDQPGAYYPPTIVTGVRQEDEIVQEEIFGPVVTVSTFKNEEEAILKANDVIYGLAASVWTSDLDRAMAVSSRVQAGSMWVNDHGPTTAEMPFGGFKQSGIGHDLSIHAIQEHMHLKHVAFSHGRKL